MGGTTEQSDPEVIVFPVPAYFVSIAEGALSSALAFVLPLMVSNSLGLPNTDSTSETMLYVTLITWVLVYSLGTAVTSGFLLPQHAMMGKLLKNLVFLTLVTLSLLLALLDSAATCAAVAVAFLAWGFFEREVYFGTECGVVRRSSRSERDDE